MIGIWLSTKITMMITFKLDTELLPMILFLLVLITMAERTLRLS